MHHSDTQTHKSGIKNYLNYSRICTFSTRKLFHSRSKHNALRYYNVFCGKYGTIMILSKMRVCVVRYSKMCAAHSVIETILCLKLIKWGLSWEELECVANAICVLHDNIIIIFVFNWSFLGQNGRHFADDIFRCILLNGKFCIFIIVTVKFVPEGPIDHNPSLV